MKLFNNICLIGNGTFSSQLFQDINNYKHEVYYNKQKIYYNNFYLKDSRDLQFNKKHLYLLTVGDCNIKQKIISDLNLDNKYYLDSIFIDSSVSKKITFNKNLVIWKSFIGDDVVFNDNIYIGPYSIIAKNSVIGNNCSIYPRVSILKNSVIGNNCSIGTNTVITDNITIGNNVSIGPNMTIYENIPSNSVLFK